MNDKEYLNQLRTEAAAAAKKVYSDKSNREKMDTRGNDKPDGGYKPSTYLYIRGYEGDTGSRPIPGGTVFWLSPDVELFDSAGTRIVTTDIDTNKNYTVQVIVTNDGDQNCNSCMVELYLDDPSIGFSVAASTLLGSKTISVMGHSFAIAEFPFNSTTAMSGHKCLFARAYSFLSNELPLDFVAFNAAEDRHLGQQNLNIIQQGTALSFNFHIRNGQIKREFTLILKSDKTIQKRMPMNIVQKYSITSKELSAKDFNFNKVTSPITRLNLGLKASNVSRLAANTASGIHRPALAELKPEMIPIARQRKETWTHVFDKDFNKLNLQIPDLGLKSGEAMPMNLWIKDDKGKIIGGITLLVTG